MATHQLIGSPISYYTGKARAYFNFKKISYREILSSTEVYKNTILPGVGFPIIPVVITDQDVTLQDTTDIIDFFEQLYPEPSIYPSTPLQKLVALLFEVYGDEWLVIPAMHYRWNYPENIEYAKQAFGATAAPQVSKEEQYQIGSERSEKFAGMVPYLGVTEKNREAIEKSYLLFLSDFANHLQTMPFLLGDRPSIGDYGLIGPLYAHLFLDPASGDIMKKQAPDVVDWVHRVHTPTDHTGNFLTNDTVPETLKPLLKRMSDEQIPVLMSTARHVAEWVDTNPGNQQIPRSIGFHRFTVEGIAAEKSISPAHLWMWQRPLDFYQSLSPNDKQRADDFLQFAPEMIKALNTPLPVRIKRDQFRFIVDLP